MSTRMCLLSQSRYRMFTCPVPALLKNLVIYVQTSLLLLCFCQTRDLHAQSAIPNDWTWNRSHAQASKPVAFSLENPTPTIDLALPENSDFGGLLHHIQTATVRVQLDLGDVHPLASNEKFSIEGFTFRLELRNGEGKGKDIVGSTVLTIESGKPVAVFSRSVALSDLNTAVRIVVEKTPATTVGIGRLVQADVQKLVRVQVSYDVTYGIHVKDVGIGSSNVSENGKYAVFSWKPLLNERTLDKRIIPNYRLQLIRLYNQDDPNSDLNTATKEVKDKLRDGSAIRSEIDWTKALTIETDNSEPKLHLLLAEGTGFYAWRVQAIGSAFDGGIANASNYGTWSSTPSKERLFLDASPLGNPPPVLRQLPEVPNTNNTLPGFRVFYYTDPEEDKVYIYSRTFTEGNRETQSHTRVSEKITYASPLQQGKQTQAYLPSQGEKGTTLSSQTIYDHSNRPAVSTLPVPTSEPGLTGYKEKLVVPEGSTDPNTRPYNAENIDTKPAESTAIDQTKPGFDYYNGKYTSKGVNQNVPDAEGFPFTRSRFYNDGTNRPLEQSGVGKTHAIGDETKGMGKTVKTYYATSSDQELIRLFGDEAPAGESVLKTTTIDQNGTTSITYTSKEGKVIATCLSFQQDTQLDPLGDNTTKVTNADQVTSNVLQEGMLVSAKRVSFDKSTPLTITYAPPSGEQAVSLGCSDSKLVCTFQVKIYIRKIDGAFPDDWSLKDANNVSWARVNQTDPTKPYTSIVYTQTGITSGSGMFTALNDETLPKGDYLIEKRLLPVSAEQTVEKSIAKMESQIGPLKQWIQEKLKNAKACGSVENMTEFYKAVGGLAKGLEDASKITDIAAQKQALAKLGTDNGLTADLFTPEHALLLYPYDPDKGVYPRLLYLSSPCCKGLKIDISYALPPFNFNDRRMKESTSDGNEGIRVNPFFLSEKPLNDQVHDNPASKKGKDMTEFFPDFEGYAYSFFWDCVPDDATVDKAKEHFLSKLGAIRDNIVDDAEKDLYSNYITSIQNNLLAYVNMGENLLEGNDLSEAQRRIQYIYYTILAPNMIGWHEPGTFNLMVQKMLTDRYSCDGQTVKRDDQGNLIKDGGIVTKFPVQERPAAIQKPDCAVVPTESQSQQCDDNGCIQYNPEQLFNCWMNKLMYLKNVMGLCPDYDAEDPWSDDKRNASEKVDSEDKNKHDSHIDDNIDTGSGILNWFVKRKVKKAKKKMSQEVRNMQNGGANAINLNPDFHIVEEFLQCTGYRFAKILTKINTQVEEPLLQDRATGVEYTQMPTLATTDLQTYDGKAKERKYKPNSSWKAARVKNEGTEENPSYKAELIFTQTKDPVYAFKYFEYEYKSRPRIEMATCFIDPNVYQTTGEPICGGTPEEPQLCDFCGIGKIRCDITHEDWTAGQRFSFYQRVLNSRPEEIEDFIDQPHEKDFTAPGFVQDIPQYLINPDLDETSVDGKTLVPAFMAWEEDERVYDPITGDSYLDLVNTKKFVLPPSGSNPNPLTLRSKVEIEITALNNRVRSACDGRSDEFAQQLRSILTAKCYQIGGCKLTSDDNIIPEADFNELVAIMIDECKRRGEVNTFRTYTTTCIPYETRETAAPIERGMVEYGVVASSTDSRCKTVMFQYKPTMDTDYTSTPPELKVPSSWQPATIPIYNCSEGIPPNPPNPSAYSYIQWNQYREVTEMQVKLQINLPDKCTNLAAATTTTTPSCTDPTGKLDAPNVSNNTAVNTSGTVASVDGPTGSTATPPKPTYMSAPTRVGLDYTIVDGKPVRTRTINEQKDDTRK